MNVILEGKFQHRNEKNAGILRITSTNGASTSIQDDPHDEQNHTRAQGFFVLSLFLLFVIAFVFAFFFVV